MKIKMTARNIGLIRNVAICFIMGCLIGSQSHSWGLISWQYWLITLFTIFPAVAIMIYCDWKMEDALFKDVGKFASSIAPQFATVVRNRTSQEETLTLRKENIQLTTQVEELKNRLELYEKI